MESNKNLYVANPQKDFTRKRKVSFYDKDFSYISETAIL